MKKTLICTLCTVFFVACSAPSGEDGRGLLLDRLTELQQRGTMFGHQDDPFYGIGWAYEDGRSDVLESCGDWPAVMGFELGGIEMGDTKNLDSVPFDRIRQEIIRHHRRGGIITISWHPRNPLTTFAHPHTWPEGSAWDATDGAVSAILADGETHALFLTWLERLRTFLASLTDEQGNAIPFIFRPWHENNGAWFWWGNTHCTPDEFRALYALTQDYINQSGIESEGRSFDFRLSTNVLWSYSPNLMGNMTEDTFLQWYPGDERIDLIGLDAYQWGSEEDFVRQTRADLDLLCAFAARHHKLVALTECGYRSVPDSTWWTRVLLPIIEAYSNPVCTLSGKAGLSSVSTLCGLSYALVWRNAENGEHFGPVPNTPSAFDFKQFFNSPQTLFLHDIQ
jgi:mannan endo-1,4-beta-mannosidase